MKLKSQLRACSLDQLREITRVWGLVPSDSAISGEKDALVEHLYPRMQSVGHFQAVFELLSPRQRDMVYFLAVHGGELPVDEMRRRCGFESADSMAACIREMNGFGLIWRERIRDKLISLDILGIPEPHLRLIDLPPYWQGFLGNCLQSLGITELKTVLKNMLNRRSATRRKQVLVHYIRRQLLDPKRLKQCFSEMDKNQLEMFEKILHRNGLCSWKDLLDSGVHKKYDHARAGQLRKLVEEAGIVHIYEKAENRYNNLLMVPRDITQIIQTGYRKDERSLVEMSQLPGEKYAGRHEGSPRPGVVLDNSNNILRDLVIICGYIHRHQVKILNNGGVGRNDLKKIIALLSHNKTTKYVSFLLLFSIVEKLLIHVGGYWRVSGAIMKWFGRGQACFRDLYDFWLNTNEWNEEFIDGDIMHADVFPQNLIGVIELRKFVLRMLEKTPAERWIDFDTFSESVLPRMLLEIPGLADPVRSERFNRHPGLILESMISESLYWMGIVILGVRDMNVASKLGSRSNEAITPFDNVHSPSIRLLGNENFQYCFRLTEFGCELLKRSYTLPKKIFASIPDPSMPCPVQSRHFTVQPNQEIVTPPDLELDRLFQLLQFSSIKKVDIMTTLNITRESVRHGMDFGLSAKDMVQFLEEGSRKDLPEVVRQMVSDCENRHGEIDMGMAGGYLVVNDTHRVAELKANPKIEPSIKDVYDDRLIILNRSSDFKKIACELQRLGFMPRVDSESLHVTNDGLFQITLKAEELYDLLAILRFAIMMEDDEDQIVFEDRVRPLFQRLSLNAKERFNPKFYADSIAKVFLANHEKKIRKIVDESTRKYKKQLNRLVTQVPRKGRSDNGYAGSNPATEDKDILKLIRFAIEHEREVKIQYLRSNGETVDQVIEPEAIQGRKIYALNTNEDQHHIYTMDRIHTAST